MHGGNKTPPAEAAPPLTGGGTLLAAGPREARSYFGISMQRHVESPLLHSQNQTLSAASRVEQA
eukprot:jgi/Chrpa1/16990/Chrysochromulina_OHIO_Genome00025632-RA